MQEINLDILKAIEKKLVSLLNCVLNKASNDPEFARQLEEVLLSDSLKAIIREKKRKPKKPTFSPVTFFHEQGKDELFKVLQGKPDSDLRGILRSEGIRKGKVLKNVEREQMIDEIVTYSERKLKQGSVFLQ